MHLELQSSGNGRDPCERSAVGELEQDCIAPVQVQDELASGVDDWQDLVLHLPGRCVEQVNAGQLGRKREVEFDLLETVGGCPGRVGQPVDHHQVDFVRV